MVVTRVTVVHFSGWCFAYVLCMSHHIVCVHFPSALPLFVVWHFFNLLLSIEHYLFHYLFHALCVSEDLRKSQRISFRASSGFYFPRSFIYFLLAQFCIFCRSDTIFLLPWFSDILFPLCFAVIRRILCLEELCLKVRLTKYIYLEVLITPWLGSFRGLRFICSSISTSLEFSFFFVVGRKR
jgi:hypothetical protein